MENENQSKIGLSTQEKINVQKSNFTPIEKGLIAATGAAVALATGIGMVEEGHAKREIRDNINPSAIIEKVNTNNPKSNIEMQVESEINRIKSEKGTVPGYGDKVSPSDIK